MIKHEGDKYVVYSESGKRFGAYSSEKEAKRRLSQMEMFKHMKKTAAAPKLKNFFAAEPPCVVHGAGTQCVTSKAPSFAKKAGLKLPKKLYSKLMTEYGGMKPLREKFGPALSASIQDEKLLRVLKSMPNKTNAEVNHIMKVTNRQNNKIKKMFVDQHMVN